MRTHFLQKHSRKDEAALPFSLVDKHPESQDSTKFVVSLLKACSKQKNLLEGNSLYADILKRGLLNVHISIGNSLINLYAKCGALAKAQQLFAELPVRDVVSWNALITGHVHHGHGAEALDCFEQMQNEPLSPNAVTYLSILKACGIMQAADKGIEIHVEIVRKGFLGEDSIMGTALLDMYAKCGELSKAQEVFDELPVQNVVSWTALAAGYVQNGHCEKAIICFEKMHQEGISPTAFTFSCILKACGNIKAADKGEEIHHLIKGTGFLGGNSVLGTALVDMYAKCGVLTTAQEVFNELSVRDIISWNALIAGYCEYGPYEEAFKCLKHMKAEELLPDAFTFACILKACGCLCDTQKGQEIHNEVVRRDMLQKNCVLGTALIDMYAKCGAITKAKEVFDNLLDRDVASWNALLAAYCQAGQGEKAMDIFDRMRREGVSPDVVTFASILKTCGNVGAAEKGSEIHAEIVSEGLLGKEDVLGSAVVDMYARCGALEKAQEVFDNLCVKDIVSWTALIAGYAHVGKHDLIFSLFSKMVGEGMKPNLVTVFVVLSACSYLGFVSEGQMYFEWISARYGMCPPVEHQSCIVDLLSRAGHFVEAIEAINRMPSADHLPLWLSLLGACRLCGNVRFGRLAFDHAVRLDRLSAVAYVCMRDIYAVVGMQEEANKIEALRVENRGNQMP